MTQEQFKKAMNDRQSQIINLEKEMRELKLTYMEEHIGFEMGEKVTVIEKSYSGVDKAHTAFIGGANVSNDGIIKYSFWKSKKDGTPSSVRLHTWGRDPEVKKLSSEQNDERSVATEADSSTDDGKTITPEG